jgi:TetR/AcrR family tetracycline transcriptional repressor
VRIRADDVIDAAFAVLDQHGLDGLTTRRLTEQLGVAVGAIYWHVRDKRELLSLLADRIVAEAALVRPTDGDRNWGVHLAGAARGMRRAMLAHRDGARLVAGYAPVSALSVATAEAGLAALVEQGVPLDLAAIAGDTVMSYVTGFVLQEQTVKPEDSAGVPAQELPLLMEWAAMRPSKDVAFERGLAIVIDGVRASLEQA